MKANFDRARRRIKESDGGWECADSDGGRGCEIASAKYKEREKEMERGNVWKKGERRTLLGERESNVEKEEVEPRERDEESERERAGSVGEERENHGAFEKVLSCRYARPLRRYRTPVRCCWPRRGRAAFSPTSSE